MGNAWLDFLAEERDKDENKDVPPMELSSHVRPKYDAWKEANGIESKSAYDKDKVEDKMEDEEEVAVVVVAKKRKPVKKGKSAKKKGKSAKKGKKGNRRGTRKR